MWSVQHSCGSGLLLVFLSFIVKLLRTCSKDCSRHYSAAAVVGRTTFVARHLLLFLSYTLQKILLSLIPTSFPLQIFQLEKFSRAFPLGLLEVPSSQKSDFLTSLQGSGFGCIPGCTGGSERDSICPVSLADGRSPCSRCVQLQHLSWTGLLVRVACLFLLQ